MAEGWWGVAVQQQLGHRAACTSLPYSQKTGWDACQMPLHQRKVVRTCHWMRRKMRSALPDVLQVAKKEVPPSMKAEAGCPDEAAQSRRLRLPRKYRHHHTRRSSQLDPSLI